MILKNTGKESEAPPQAPKGAFVLDAQATIADVNAHVEIYKHSKSGMSVLTMVPEDGSQDAVFGLNFRTKSTDNSGAAYIVEKSIQDGSANFPVKDPFNQLARGSLQTHMETWTERDRTSYVYASRNKADFRNGIKVYLDGVFKPSMLNQDHNWIFRQEAWRLFLTGEDGLQMALSGNAINDAKSRQMNPAAAHEDFVFEKVFADHPYSWKEKGDFRQIVTLNRSKMRDFYKKFYHPSNGQAFCYGPQDFVAECLNLMEPYLSEYDADIKIRKQSEIEWKDFESIKTIKDKVAYPSYQETNDFRLAVSYILNDQPMDETTRAAWFIIEELLVGNPASVIPRLIVELNLGDDVIGGINSQLRQWIFTLGVSGSPTEAKAEEARVKFEERIVEVASNGFDEEAIKGALNAVEMRFREQSANGEPRGVQLFKTVLPYWNYDEDPRKAFALPSAFEEVKKKIEQDGQEFLLNLITRYLVDNPHRVVTELFPSTGLAAAYAQQEREWLGNTDSWMSQEQGAAILNESKELREIQETPDSQEDLDKISSLSISDLRTTNFEFPNKVHNDIFDSGITMLEHELPHTNGVAYVDFSIDISNLDFDDVVLLPLFCQLLLQGGNDRKNSVQMQREINEFTGGIEVIPLVEEMVATGSDGSYVVPNGEHMITKIVVRSSCLADTGCLPMFSLIKHILYDANVQQEAKAIEVLKKMIDDMEDDVQTNSHVYTTLRVQSQYGLSGFIREQWKGITQLLNLRRALEQARSDWDTLSMRLVLMADAMRRGHRNGMALSLTGDKDAIKGIANGVQTFVVDELPPPTQKTKFPDFATEVHPWHTKGLSRMNEEIKAEGHSEAFIVPSRVNAVAKGGILFDAGEPIRGADLVVLQFIGGYFLFDQLRFGQGASEAWAVVDVDTGSVVYQSDQDPNIVETLNIYDRGSSWVSQQISGLSTLPVEAEGAVIGAIGALDDTAMQPAVVGFASLVQWLKGDTIESRQKFRDEILGANIGDFKAMIDRLGSWGKTSVAVVTNEAQFDEAVAEGLALTKCDYTGLAC